MTPIIEEYEYESLLKYYKEILIDYTIKLHTTGLESGDYCDINQIISNISKKITAYCEDVPIPYRRKNRYGILEKSKAYYEPLTPEEIQLRKYLRRFLKELNKLKYDFIKLRDLLKREIIGYETDEYVNKVSSLTHLVFTKTSHEKVILSSTDSFQFICPVHFERTPSCRVFNGRRELFCYGCHKEHKPIDFLERVEYIDEAEALNLLAAIYLIDIEPTPEIGIDNIHLIEKYRNTLTSDEFKLLLERAYERTKKKRQTAAVRSAIDTFEEDFATIERVKKGKHDIFVPKKEKPKTLILERPDRH